MGYNYFMRSLDFKNKFLSPFFAGFFVVIAMIFFYIICFLCRLKFGVFDVEDIGATEILTYLFYGFSLGIVVCCAKDFLDSSSKNKSTFFALIFLWFAALFREMGIQHWLTTHDSAVTKTRFFLNPQNPLHEKIVAGVLMLLVLAVFVWVICKYLKILITGFLKLRPIQWTCATFAFLAFVTQIADRFPANYFKAAGVNLVEPVLFCLKILEECGESLLPLLFAIAFLQYHFILKNRESKTK